MMLTADEIVEEFIRDSKFFHFGTLFMTHEGVREATKSTQARRRVELYHIFFNPNLCTPLWNSLAHCHILELLVNDFQCSQERELYGKHGVVL